MKRLFAILLLPVFFVSSAATADEGLSADELKALFTGKTAYAYHLHKDLDIIAYFDADGTTRQLRNGNKWTGTWRIDEAGQHCIQLQDPYSGNNKPERCRTIKKEGKKYVRYKTTDSGNLAAVVKYKKFKDGNPKNL